MIRKELTVGGSLGLHARPSLLITQAAKSIGSSTIITIFNPKNGSCADARSILGILSLAVIGNQEVILETNGPEEEQAFKVIADIIENFKVE